MYYQPDKGANFSMYLISHSPDIHTDEHSCKYSSDMMSKQECFDDPIAVMKMETFVNCPILIMQNSYH